MNPENAMERRPHGIVTKLANQRTIGFSSKPCLCAGQMPLKEKQMGQKRAESLRARMGAHGLICRNSPVATNVNRFSLLFHLIGEILKFGNTSIEAHHAGQEKLDGKTLVVKT